MHQKYNKEVKKYMAKEKSTHLIEGKSAVPCVNLTDAQMRHTTRLVYSYLWDQQSNFGSSPFTKVTAKRLGLNARTISRAKSELGQLGLLTEHGLMELPDGWAFKTKTGKYQYFYCYTRETGALATLIDVGIWSYLWHCLRASEKPFVPKGGFTYSYLAKVMCANRKTIQNRLNNLNGVCLECEIEPVGGLHIEIYDPVPIEWKLQLADKTKVYNSSLNSKSPPKTISAPDKPPKPDSTPQELSRDEKYVIGLLAKHHHRNATQEQIQQLVGHVEQFELLNESVFENAVYVHEIVMHYNQVAGRLKSQKLHRQAMLDAVEIDDIDPGPMLAEFRNSLPEELRSTGNTSA